MPPFVQGGVCSVIPPRQAANKQEATRKVSSLFLTPISV